MRFVGPGSTVEAENPRARRGEHVFHAIDPHPVRQRTSTEIERVIPAGTGDHYHISVLRDEIRESEIDLRRGPGETHDISGATGNLVVEPDAAVSQLVD